MGDLMIRAVRLASGDRVDIRIHDGLIAEIGSLLAMPDGMTVEDGANRLVLPGLVNGHTHIDKTFFGAPWQPHGAGPTVADRIRHEREVLAAMNLDVVRHAGSLLREMVAQGTTHVRTHVDVTPEGGTAALESVLTLREQCADWMDMEIVAFPQTGVMRAPGALELLERALDLGADLLGGIDPVGLDRDPRGQLDGLFSMAERRDVGLDIHLHDAGEMGAVSVDMIAERTHSHGLRGRVVLSHGFCLGSVLPARRDALIESLHAAGIAVMSHGPGGGTPVPPVALLHQRGVQVFAGTDGVRDAWGPLNSPSMLERAFLVSYVNGFRDDDGLALAMHMITEAGARIMGIDDYGLAPGCSADLIVLDAENVAHAVATHPTPALVVKRGSVVARDGRCTVAPF